MKTYALLAAAVLLGCAPSSQVTEGGRRGQDCPGGRREGEAWCAPCWTVLGEPQFKQNICEGGRIRPYGPCTSEAVCRAPAPAASDARSNLTIYEIAAPDRGCIEPGEGDKAVMLLNRSKDYAIWATVRSAQTGLQRVTVPRAGQIRLGCAAQHQQPTNWTVVQADWAQ